MSKEQLEQGQSKLDLFPLLRGLRRSCRHMLVFGVVLTVLLTGLMCLRTWRSYSAQYQASASFTVQMTNPLYASQQYYNASAAEQMAETFPYILTSGVLSRQVMDTMGISHMPAVSASAMGSTNIFSLTVTSGDAQLAYDVLQCVMEVYPSVAEFVVGPTTLTLLSESGVPSNPLNALSFTRPIMMGVILGVGLWLVISLLYWLTHKTVCTEEELRRVVNLPYLGSVPKMRSRGKKKEEYPIVNDTNDKFGFNESIRLLRVRVEKAMAKHNSKVLVVTSTIPNEGKTTVSINLATALAQRGKRTLLVDCDLRNPSVGGPFERKSDFGFAEFLRGECTLEEAFHHMEIDNLYAIFGGKVVSNPEELLASRNVKKFMDAARKTLDYIILDTPPCGTMADAVEIGALADCTLLVVRQDFACRQQILEGVQLLGDSKKPIIGAALNMTTPKLSKSSSYYGYGYGYGYHGSDEEDDKE